MHHSIWNKRHHQYRVMDPSTLDLDFFGPTWSESFCWWSALSFGVRGILGVLCGPRLKFPFGVRGVLFTGETVPYPPPIESLPLLLPLPAPASPLLTKPLLLADTLNRLIAFTGVVRYLCISVYQLISWSVDQCISWSVYQLISWSVDLGQGWDFKDVSRVWLILVWWLCAMMFLL